MTATPKRILYITSAWPKGRAFGGQLRALHVGRALKQVGEVTVLYVGADAADLESSSQTAAEFSILPPIKPVQHRNQRLTDKLRWAFDTTYLNLHGFVASAADSARLSSYLPDFDLVWILNARTPNILQRWHWPKAHLDLDDIPSTYLRTVAHSGATRKVRWKARVLSYLNFRRERRLLERFRTLSVCSAEDRVYMGADSRVSVIPNGFDRPTSEPSRRVQASPPRIGFIGLYSYAPNLEGMRWFLRECWPDIRRAVPGVQLRLIGKDTDGPLKPLDLGVEALGWVADPAAEMATWSATVVPIHFGGGTRIKIAEAFSRKCPAVSTSLGAFGYDVANGNQLLIADAPAEFSQACIELVQNPEKAEKMAERAWREYLDKWTWDAIAPRVWSAAETCLNSGRSLPESRRN